MIDQSTILELVHTDLDALAKQAALRIHENLSLELTASANAQIDEWLAENTDATDLEQQARDLIQPAYTWRLTAWLSDLLGHSADGWSDVFYGNLTDEYDEGRLTP